MEITPAGLERFDAAHVVAEPLAEGLVADLGPDDTEQLTRLLARLAHPGGREAQGTGRADLAETVTFVDGP
ncbi:hypothetical protein [Streptomyces sp. NPDC005930]|uniref:hypothetical protein n=1 Tax=Streptomyces sp. NPDC005930 TaxID=3364736 RepID=UPI003680A1F2